MSTRPRQLSRPHTGQPLNARTPRRLPTATGGGDTIPINLDAELQTVLKKEYDDGEQGKKDAIKDVKSVLRQIAQDPMAQQMDKVLPRFLAPPNSQDEVPHVMQTSKSRSKPLVTPRHGKLTARPSTTTGKDGYKILDDRPSIPNISRDDETRYHDTTMRITASAPHIPDTRYDTVSPVPSSAVAPSSSSCKSRAIKTVETSTTEGPRQHSYHYSQSASTALSTTTAPVTASVDDKLFDHGKEEREGYLPFTENLLEITSDAEEQEEVWKSDIVELTRIKSAPKGKCNSGPDILELKYKDPIWPHQLFLNQILARLPRLTHLVLDGSELRFLRDLGSSLQSLLTLSICDCGLRSLDGAYGMPNLRTLIARKNMIKIPTQLSFLRRLSYLDLSSNPICSADEFGSLSHCGELRVVKLYDTPLAINQSNFNKEIKRLVPQLKEIHPTRLYDLVGLPKLMVRSNQIIGSDTIAAAEAGHHHRNPGQNQHQKMREESKQVGAAMVRGGETNRRKEKSRRNDPSMMPSLAYDDVMVDQSKPGIAYQKIETSKTLKEQEQEHRQKQSEIKDVSLGTGDFTGIFMAPKFLQHLEETMPPSTANNNDDDDIELENHVERQDRHQELQSHHRQHHESFSVAANFHQNKILHQEEVPSSKKIHGNTKNVLWTKSDRGQEEQQKNHPRGDGDPGCH